MKKYIIIGLLLLAFGAYLILPLIKNSGASEDDYLVAATFNFKENLATTYGADVPIAFTVNSKEAKQIELIYNDSIFKTWENPTGKITFLLDADCYGVGTKSIVLRTTLKDGSSEDDIRNLRVLSDVSPKPLQANVIQSFPHDPLSYTQGLEFNNGQLFEGTGDPGQLGKSIVAQVDLSTGKIGKKMGIDANYFGEGITLINNDLYQLTWQSGKCFVYDKNTMLLTREYAYTGEGWGLCNDGKQLIMSDGSERITFRDPKTFSVIRTIEVYDNVGPRMNINELEYIDGKIYANIWQTDVIIVIDPISGKVLEEIDASPLAIVGKMGGEVLNGIAYNPANKKLYMTGKNWGKLLEVSITEK